MIYQVVTFKEDEGIRNEGLYATRSEAEMDAEYAFHDAKRRAVLDLELFPGFVTKYRSLRQDGANCEWSEWSDRFPTLDPEVVKIETCAVRSDYL